ncbi:MAG: biopolymer transporter ExbD [Bacteroidales bacterium]|nr:biopolymer transporter ExbD [Bacteroidales bacterium]
MAIKKTSKINASFSMASMTDIVFLLLIFFMITSTMISPNALKLLLPQSNSQTTVKAYTSVSITKDFQYYVESQPVNFSDLETTLKTKMVNAEDPVISLHVEQSVPVEYMVRDMNIAQRNQYKLILATRPETPE